MKRNKKMGMFNNMIYMLKQAVNIDKTLVFLSISLIPITVLIPLVNTYLSRFIVEVITNRDPLNIICLGLLGFTALLVALNQLNKYLTTKIKWKAFSNRFHYMDMCAEKVMDTDYENIEKSSGQLKMQKTLDNLSSLQGGTQKIFEQAVSIISNGAGLIAYSVLIFRISPWIVAVLLIMSSFIYWEEHRNRNWLYANKDTWLDIDRKILYIHQKAGDFKAAKDIRLYQMQNWLESLFSQMLGNKRKWNIKKEEKNFMIELLSAAAVLVRDATAYGILIYQVLHQQLDAAEFVFYFSLVTQYAGWMFGMVDAYNELKVTNLDIIEIREFLEMPDRQRRGTKAFTEEEMSFDIEFKNLSFRHEGSPEDTIHNFNLTIKEGEKLAIVGSNGAGKTTLVKLLCGLYTPSEGEISIGGRKAGEFQKKDYYSLFSAVFQDIHLLPVSVEKNIALCEEKEINKVRLEKVLKDSGLYEKAENLPQKEKTLLMHNMYEEAVDLSGGEKQKLALARALYKEGEIFILDEPTAALDAIAENEIYLKYNEMTKGRTSIFISHRLASTQFCDRIILIDDGKIIEEGTHEQLMEKQGKYAEMFHIQSQYYKDGVQL